MVFGWGGVWMGVVGCVYGVCVCRGRGVRMGVVVRVYDVWVWGVYGWVW